MIKNSLEQIFRGDILGLGFISDDQAMAKDIVADRFHIVGSDIPRPSRKASPFAARVRKIVARGLAPY